MLVTPHDMLFKVLFADPRRAAEVLRAVMPPEVVRHIDWSTLAHERESFIDEQMQGLQADLLFSAVMDGRAVKIHVLFEHQSSYDRQMSRRLLRYMDRMWDGVAKGEGALLSAIMPVVLYHGDEPWPGATDFHAMFDMPPACAPFVPQFRFVLVDLTALDPAVVLDWATSACARLGLLAMQAARSPAHLDELLLGWRDLIREVMAEPFEDGALGVIFRYIMAVRGDAAYQRAVHVMTEYEREHTGGTMESIAQKLIKEGRVEGLRLGRDEGRIVGRAEGKQSMLLDVIEQRLGEVPAAVRAQIEAADDAELQRWLMRALRSNSVAELLAG